MKTIDPKDRLEGDWEPSDVPDLRPDAPAVAPPTLRVLPRAAPSLCQQGPCRNYHEVVLELDAQQPLDHSDASSKGHRVRTCYPSSGIEMPLDAPVFECNRWDPDEGFALELRRDAFMRTEAGITYTADLDAWKGDQERIRKEENELAKVDVTELDTIGELRATMEDGDDLELRRRGETDLLLTLQKREPDDSEFASFVGGGTKGTGNDELVGKVFGHGEYQIRHIRKKRIIAIKNLVIEDPNAQETSE